MSETLEAALAYAARGWYVFPLGEGSKLPKIAKAAGGRGFHDATRYTDQLETWFTRWPRANIGVRTGATSGIFVLDVDVCHRGDDSLDRLTMKHGRLPCTLTARTPSGGWHFYLAWPGVELRNSAGALDDGLDIRAEGGYVAAPPSVIPRVGTYEWQQGQSHVAAAPAWLLRLLRKPERPTRPSKLVTLPRDVAVTLAQRVLAERARQVTTAPVSRRNVTLNACAFYIGSHFVAAGLLESAEVWAVLTDAAISAGLGDRETRATIASGLSAGIALPARSAS
jgi:hypothetical protein